MIKKLFLKLVLELSSTSFCNCISKTLINCSKNNFLIIFPNINIPNITVMFILYKSSIQKY